MEYVIMIGQLILSLSILIVLHEMGHFFPAKMFGTRVEKFYLFFDAGFSLFKYKKGETEYGIGWLPLGGYVKIAGMVDESMDLEQLKQPPQPWEFRSKPTWQRLIIMLGGVTVNFILGFLLYAMVLFIWGEEYMPAENIAHGIQADSIALQMGLMHGDKILSVGDEPFTEFSRGNIIRGIMINSADNIKVERNGQKVTIPIDEKYISILSKNVKKSELISPRVPFIAADVKAGFPAKKAGIQNEDQLIAFNDIPTPYFHDFQDLAKKHKNQEVKITVLRNKKDTMDFNLTTTEDGLIGIVSYNATYFFDTERRQYTLMQALPAGVTKGWGVLTDQVKAFGQIFKGKMSAGDSLGGFGSIGKMYGGEWIWERFWMMTALLSLILAFMNLLPIPALDGGHVMFLMYEMVTGRKPSDKFLEYATIIGFVFVMGLVLYANGLDIYRAIFE